MKIIDIKTNFYVIV